MALERFIPKSPDANIRNSQDFEVAKFGHLNTIVEYINNNSAKPAGLNGYIQFNDNNALGGSPNLVWNNSTNSLTLGSGTTSAFIDFASNPAGSTTIVGAIRTYVDGVNLSEVMTFREDGNVGFGTTSPTNAVSIERTTGNAILSLQGNAGTFISISRFSDNTARPRLELYKSRGTIATPAVVQTGDELGSIDFYAYDGSANQRVGILYVPAESVVGSTITPQMAFGLGTSAVANQYRMVIKHDGNVTIGNSTTTLGARLGIKGSGSTSATTSLLVQNSAGTASLTVNDAGNATIAKDIFVQNVQVGRGIATGIYNTAMGQYVLGGVVGSSTASYTTAIGQAAGAYVASGIHAIIIGAEAVGIAPSVNNSVIIGSQVFAGTTSGISNTLAIGTGNSATYWPTIYATNINTDSPNVRIGNNSAARAAVPTAPTASAILELSSTTKGFLPPRMTTAQKNAIATPAAGLVIYDTDLNKLCVYTTAWQTITSA